MEKTYTEEEMIERVFEANKQRGKYLAFIVKELDNVGFKGFDETLKKAIYCFGKDKSVKWGNLDSKTFMNCMLPDDIIKGMLQFKEVGSNTEDRAEFTFHRCPLEEGWKEMGLSDDERRRLCAIAQEHDFGIVANESNQDLELEMPEGIGLGDPVCRLVIKKK